MTDAKQKQACKALARKECANHRDGYCMFHDTACGVVHDTYSIHDGAICCDYFLTAVLPLDKPLCTEVWTAITQGTPAIRERLCAYCGDSFRPTARAQKYCCSECAASERKRQEAKRQRQRRNST